MAPRDPWSQNSALRFNYFSVLEGRPKKRPSSVFIRCPVKYRQLGVVLLKVNKMSERVASIIGSGTIPYTRAILPAAQRGDQPLGEGVRNGTQVMIGNPEDLLAVDIWAASGVVVGVTPVQIFGPNTNPLPRTRLVIIENLGSQALIIAPTEAGATVADGFTIPTPAAGVETRLELPLLHNNEIWARSASATTTVKLIIL